MQEFKKQIENLLKRLDDLKIKFDFLKKEKELMELKKKVNSPDFWQKEKEAFKIQKKFTTLKERIEKLKLLEKEIKDLKELSDLISEDSKDFSFFTEKIKNLKEEIKNEEKEFFLSGPYDKNSAIISIQAGAGGRDAEDWVTLLLRMYQKYCQKKKWSFKILHQSFSGGGGGPEGRIGTREVSFEINQNFAFGFLKKENGVHRLVRISPFSAKGLRHTSFAKVEVIPKLKEAQISQIKIKPQDLKIETFRASGPGGQYVNRRESAVRITHLPTRLQATSQAERLQGLNRKIAMEILIAKLLAFQEKVKQKELEKLKGKKVSAEFGNQIRSYILHPYKLVKDHRTGVETSNIEEVLEGNLDEFIEAEIKL